MSTLKFIDGLPVIDATKPIFLNVANDDIAHADRKKPGNCVAAQACRRELRCAEVRIHISRVYVRMNTKNWVRYVTPAALRSEIVAFDRGGKFEVGSFTLKAPPKTQRLTGKRQGGKDAPRPRPTAKHKRRPYTVVKGVRPGPG